MRKCLGTMISDFEKELNLKLLNKEYDRDLVESIVDVWKSLEVDPHIKIISYEYNEDESNIDVTKFSYKRDKKKKKKERFDYKNIEDDRVGTLTVNLEITLKEPKPDGRLDEFILHKYPISKTILIPLKDEHGGMFLKGKKYYLIWQMLEKSTYTSNNCVTLKSLMPVAIKRNIVTKEAVSKSNLTTERLMQNSIDVVDYNGKEYKLPIYNVFVYMKEIPCILFYLSHGFYWALDYLEVGNIIDILPGIPEERDDDLIYFSISGKCVLSVLKELFEKYRYVQSIVGGILSVCSNRTTIDNIDDPENYIKKLVNPNNLEKGKNILRSFNRLLDEGAKKNILVRDRSKSDIYAVIRWMMQEYNNLRLKNNLSLDNKRLRCNEILSSILTLDFSKRLTPIINMGEKATIDNYRDMFKFSGDILISRMHSSGVLRCSDAVNDMSIWEATRYTLKGIQSLGGKNSQNVSIKYLALDPSFIGKVDMLVCSSSSPGETGSISPFIEMAGLYFDPTPEPEDISFQLAKDTCDIMKNKGKIYITVRCEEKEDYYNLISKLEETADENTRVYGISKEGSLELIVEKPIDIRETSDEEDVKEKDISIGE